MSHLECWKSCCGRLVVIGLLLMPIVGCGPKGNSTKPARSENQSSYESAESVPEKESSPFELESGYKLLTIDDFEKVEADSETWKSTGEQISCSGKPKGYLASKQEYQNFTLRLELKYDRPKELKDPAKFPGNTGILVYINGEPKVWPTSLEVQGKYVQLGDIKENGGAAPVEVQYEKSLLETVRKPLGDWNALEIVSKDGEISVQLNGHPMAHSKAGDLKSGRIGIQAENFPFHIRRIRLHVEEPILNEPK